MYTCRTGGGVVAIAVEKRDGTAERKVVAGLVISRSVLGRVAARWEPELFPSRWAQLIGGWCVEHYRKYRKAPGKAIEDYFHRWAESTRDRDSVELVESFLASCAADAAKLKRELSPDHVVDLAAGLFNRHRVDELRRQIEADLESGDSVRAVERAKSFREVEIGTGAGIDVLAEESAFESAFDDRGDDLVVYPDALGSFFRGSLLRDCFVGFIGKDKVGKSYWIFDLAWRAVEQGRNVAYFEVGDMSQSQILRRVAARAAGRPVRGGKYEWPVRIESNGGRNEPSVETEWRDATESLTSEETNLHIRRLCKRVGPDRFKLACHPNSTLSVPGIESALDGYDRDGWRPDIVVIDYADILAPIDRRAEKRDQVNDTWKAMRAMSQRRHCLVVTATQTNADAYTARTLSRENFSEDKRKLAHVTGMVGINQTDAEKKKSLYRLNWVVLRELEFSESDCVWCASALGAASPAVLSCF